MHPQYQGIIFDFLRPSLEAAQKTMKPGQRSIVVTAGPGHGDNARGIAFCNALKAALGQKAHIFLVMHFTGSMVEIDMGHYAHECGVVDSYVPLQGAPPEAVVAFCVPHCDVVFDVRPYAVVTYFNVNADHPRRRMQIREQVAADQRLKPFQQIALAHPLDNWRLRNVGLSQWDLMSLSTGISVSELDLLAPLECAPLPEHCPFPLAQGSDDAEKAMRGLRKRPYAVLHNSAGAGSRTKCAPPAVFEAVVAALAEAGVVSVQIGGLGDDLIDGCEDRRGYRLPVGNRLIQDALCVVAVEGFIPFMSAALGTPTVVLFGPTQPHTFGLASMRQGQEVPWLSLVRLIADPTIGARVPCPVGTCFWGGGFSWGEGWAAECPMGKQGNGSYPWCANFLKPDEAAEQVSAFVAPLLAGRAMQVQEAVA